MRRSLVFGESGLIGGGVLAALRDSESVIAVRKSIEWLNKELVESQIQQCVRSFFEEAQTDDWDIYWLAGKGGFSASQEQLDFDQKNFQVFLSAVESCSNRPGLIILASSAGSVYASGFESDIDENSPTHENSPYGICKLRQEDALKDFVERVGHRGLVTRISTVFGPGGNPRNSYGLVSRLCIADILHQPVDIFVPLETSRNYIYSEDAGRLIVEIAQAHQSVDDGFMIRNVVSPTSVSIAEIVNICSRLFKHRIVLSNRIDERKLNYSTRFDIRSLYINDIKPVQWTALSVGISNVRNHLIGQLQSGELASIANSTQS